jgi:hypothetical protein
MYSELLHNLVLPRSPQSLFVVSSYMSFSLVSEIVFYNARSVHILVLINAAYLGDCSPSYTYVCTLSFWSVARSKYMFISRV